MFRSSYDHVLVPSEDGYNLTETYKDFHVNIYLSHTGRCC
jgi:hypothetical protein